MMTSKTYNKKRPVNRILFINSLIKTLVTRCRQFQQAVELFRGKIIIEKINRIKWPAVLMYFVMTMGSGRFTRIANPADNFAPFDPRPILYFNPKHMTVKGFVAVPVIDYHVIPEAVP